MRYLLLNQKSDQSRWIKEQLAIRLSHESPQIDTWVVRGSKVRGDNQVHLDYELWLSKLNTVCEADSVSIIVATKIEAGQLNPLQEGFAALIAMLILAYPDVSWSFLDCEGFENTLHDFQCFHTARTNPLFDATGLRDFIRHRMQSDEHTSNNAAHIPRRKKLAFSFDEECDYASLHAYAAYRFGFSAAVACNLREAISVVGRNSIFSNKARHVELSLEDLYLNLPDQQKERHYSCLYEDCDRHQDFPGLEQSEHRVIVSSGQQLESQRKQHVKTRSYISQQRAGGKFIRELRKPHTGILNIWKEVGLDQHLRWVDKDSIFHRGTGEGYIWPPKWELIERSQNVSSGGHSAPGVLVVIAKHLVDRASAILKNDTTLEDDLLGAVLATDALELLGGKTPTLSAQALALKHLLEVRAVCHFAGVEHHIPMKPHWQEIKLDSKAIARWFHPDEQRRAELNIQMDIANKMVKLLRDENQFDEEQFWADKARRIHNDLWMRSTKYSWGKVLLPFLRYFELLLSSFPRFCGAILVWLFLLSGIFYAIDDFRLAALADQVEPANHPASFLSYAATTLFGAEPVLSYNPLWFATTFLASLIGITHLGIFISHLYSIVSRR